MPQASWPSGNNWPPANSYPQPGDGGTVPGPVFPAAATPVVWFDGNQQAFSDLAGTLPVSSGLIRRINEAPAQGGSWQTTSDAERPLRDSNGVRFELNSSTGGSAMTRAAAGGLNAASVTLVVSFDARASAVGGPQTGLFATDDNNAGIIIGSNQVWVLGPAIFWTTSGLTITHGVRNTILASYSATGIELVVNAGGVISRASFVGTVASTALSSTWTMSHHGTAAYLYGSIAQAYAIAQTIGAGATQDALMTYAHAQPATGAYQADRTLVAFIGDSITAMTATAWGSGYPFLFQQSARLVPNLVEVCDTALGGVGVPNILSTGSVLMRANAFYSSQRAKNIAVILLGSNDLVGGNSVQYLVNGAGAAGGNGLYQACDFLRSVGWKVVLLTVGPRSDAASIAAGFNALRAAANTEIKNNGPAHADLVIDTTGIVNFGIDGDSNNPTYYSADLIHPLAAGHANLAAVVTPALLALL